MIHRPDMYGKNILAILPQRRGAVACLEAADMASKVLQHSELKCYTRSCSGNTENIAN